MLQNLHAEQERLRGTAADWAQCNGALEAAVSQACTPRELERFRRFMTDLERVLGLLLLLGSRLTRVNLALARAGSNSDPDERVKEVEVGARAGFGGAFVLPLGSSREQRCSLCPLLVVPGLSAAATPASAATARRC